MSAGLHARRATGFTVAESEESFPRTESVARWSRVGRAAYEAEREYLLFDFFFDRSKVFQSGRKISLEGTACFFFLSNVLFQFHCFSGAAVPCCALSFVHTASIPKKKRITLPGVCTYERPVSERSGRNRPRREACGVRAVFS